jgi:cysteinyl-tRNA synthetase
MGAIYNFIAKAHPALQVNNLDMDQKNYIIESLDRLNQVLQIFRLKGCQLVPEVNALIQKREQARADKDWQAADAARTELAQKGIIVIDTVNGPIWKKVAEVE